MKIKICGLFREQDIGYVNEARPDYAGFVFAESRRKVSPAFAAKLRESLSKDIIPVGVFVNAIIEDIATLYRDNIISIAQLHGTEDGEYVKRLKEASAAGGGTPVPVIKTIKINHEEINHEPHKHFVSNNYSDSQTNLIDYYLFDSGAGSGKAFNWEILNSFKFEKPWFLAGGINPDNIERAAGFNPYALDISGGAETDGIKDREKIVQLVSTVRTVNKGKDL